MNYTEQEWIDLMRSDPTNAGYMLLFADWLTENGWELEGEAMRLLGETGRVGMWCGTENNGNGYFSRIVGYYASAHFVATATVPSLWMNTISYQYRRELGELKYDPVFMRMCLAKVYAEQATPEEREDWQRELRGLEVA